jgi:hypothetical protein
MEEIKKKTKPPPRPTSEIPIVDDDRNKKKERRVSEPRTTTRDRSGSTPLLTTKKTKKKKDEGNDDKGMEEKFPETDKKSPKKKRSKSVNFIEDLGPPPRPKSKIPVTEPWERPKKSSHLDKLENIVLGGKKLGGLKPLPEMSLPFFSVNQCINEINDGLIELSTTEKDTVLKKTYKTDYNFMEDFCVIQILAEHDLEKYVMKLWKNMLKYVAPGESKIDKRAKYGVKCMLLEEAQFEFTYEKIKVYSLELLVKLKKKKEKSVDELKKLVNGYSAFVTGFHDEKALTAKDFIKLNEFVMKKMMRGKKEESTDIIKIVKPTAEVTKLTMGKKKIKKTKKQEEVLPTEKSQWVKPEQETKKKGGLTIGSKKNEKEGVASRRRVDIRKHQGEREG